ncbi:MAG: hypothetical protein OQK04_03915, partial [Kangiellaceae bacterium]|nr:hypothetical protein [Kangiellaceae bacterium]
ILVSVKDAVFDATNPRVNIPSDCYALMVKGAELAPRMYEGDVLLISPGYPISPGSEIFVEFASGERGVFNLISRRAQEITMAPLAAKQNRIVRSLSDIDFMHAIVAVVNPAMLVREGEAIDSSQQGREV